MSNVKRRSITVGRNYIRSARRYRRRRSPNRSSKGTVSALLLVVVRSGRTRSRRRNGSTVRLSQRRRDRRVYRPVVAPRHVDVHCTSVMRVRVLRKIVRGGAYRYRSSRNVDRVGATIFRSWYLMGVRFSVMY